MTPPVPLHRLVREEARALPRGRFALAGAAVLAAALALLGSVVATSWDGLWNFAILAYGFAPALFAGFAASHVSSLRATRFGQSLYTTPVRSRDVLLAKILVMLGLAGLYFLATLPFLAVTAIHVDVPPQVLRFALVGAGMLVFAIAFGTMLAVLMPGRSASAPAVLATGAVLLSFFAMPYAWQSQFPHAAGSGDDLRLVRVSPHLLLNDATDLMAPYMHHSAAAPGRALFLFVLETAACFGIALWAYTRAQGPETWESRPAHRVALVALAVAALLLPAVAAASGYERLPGDLQVGRSWSTDTRNASIMLVPHGEAVAEFHLTLAGTRDQPLEAGERNARDLVLRLPAPADRAVESVSFTVEGAGGLDVSRTRFEIADVGAPGAGIQVERWPEGGVVLRVPLALTPKEPLDLTHNYYPLWVNVTYALDGETTTREGAVATSVRADVPGVRLHMALAGAPLLIGTTTAALQRRLRIG
jgi:hypothetical protein